MTCDLLTTCSHIPSELPACVSGLTAVAARGAQRSSSRTSVCHFHRRRSVRPQRLSSTGVRAVEASSVGKMWILRVSVSWAEALRRDCLRPHLLFVRRESRWNQQNSPDRPNRQVCFPVRGSRVHDVVKCHSGCRFACLVTTEDRGLLDSRPQLSQRGSGQNGRFWHQWIGLVQSSRHKKFGIVIGTGAWLATEKGAKNGECVKMWFFPLP